MLSDTMMLGGGRTAAYPIQNSLLFRGGQYLSRTPSVAGNQQKWTFSAWVKRGTLGVAQNILHAYQNATTYTYLYFTSGDVLNFSTNEGGAIAADISTKAVFRDANAWYHIVLKVDLAAPTVTIYVNGVVQAVTVNVAPTIGNTLVNAAGIPHRIGTNANPDTYFNGYLAEPILVDGAALTAASFGEADPVTGSWRPKAPHVPAWGANGTYLGKPWNAASLGTDGSGVLVTPQTTSQNTANAGLSTLSGQGLAGNTVIDLSTPLPTGAAVTAVGYYSLVPCTVDLKLLRKNATGSYTVVANQTLIHPGTGWADVTLASKVVLPCDATYYIGSYNTTGSAGCATNLAYAAIASNQTSGTNTGYTERGTGGVPATRLTYSVTGNNWMASGFAASDVVRDTPTNVFATLNPLNASPQTALNNGNLSLAPYGANKQNYSTFPIPSMGKWVFETSTTVNNSGGGVGVTVRGVDLMNSGVSGPFYAYMAFSGNKYSPGPTHSSYGGSWDTSSDIAACVIDRDGGTIEFFKNGVSQGVAFTGVSASLELYAWIGANNDPSAVRTINFGQRTFAYPNAYGAAKPLCTANLPVPTITKPKKHMGVVTYTGNGGIKAVTGVGFQPDFVWMKCRNAVSSHQLFDSVRGAGNRLYSDLTNAEDYLASSLISFDADGFTLGNFGQNASGNDYVAWCWKAGSTAVANTAGTIAAQVSANPAAGFSVVTFTSAGTNATIGHGLGSAPKLFFMKKRSDASDWSTYHAYANAVPQSGLLFLNLADGFTSDQTRWNNKAPTATQISIGTNIGAGDYVAYCWSEVPGFSKFGGYTGEGSADGPYVYCGFRPRFILTKCVGAATSWELIDTARDTANVAAAVLFPNLSHAEFTGATIDVDATGFKVRAANGNWNQSGQTTIYAAFAEYPLGGGKVTPAKAR